MGHGNQKAPAKSPRAARAARTPVPTRAMPRLRSSRPSGCESDPSSGTSSHAAPYNNSPAPPMNTSTTSVTRTMIGSMSRWRARPAENARDAAVVVAATQPTESRTSLRVGRGGCWSGRSAGRGSADGGGEGFVMAPVNAAARPRTIGDDPDPPPPAPRSRLRVGSGSILMVGGRPACDDGSTMSNRFLHPPLGPPPFRRAARDTESPIAGGVSGDWPGTWACPSCGCASRSWSWRRWRASG
jgi:hypothetical protein